MALSLILVVVSSEDITVRLGSFGISVTAIISKHAYVNFATRQSKFSKPFSLSVLPLPKIVCATFPCILAVTIHHTSLNLASITVAVRVRYLTVPIRLIVKPLTRVLAN